MSVLSTSNNYLKCAGFDENGELTFVSRHELNLIHFPLFSEDDGEDITKKDLSLNAQTTTENK